MLLLSNPQNICVVKNVNNNNNNQHHLHHLYLYSSSEMLCVMHALHQQILLRLSHCCCCFSTQAQISNCKGRGKGMIERQMRLYNVFCWACGNKCHLLFKKKTTTTTTTKHCPILCAIFLKQENGQIRQITQLKSFACLYAPLIIETSLFSGLSMLSFRSRKTAWLIDPAVSATSFLSYTKAASATGVSWTDLSLSVT